jgi:hypothetical protein
MSLNETKFATSDALCYKVYVQDRRGFQRNRNTLVVGFN